jgi:hypothetical protein
LLRSRQRILWDRTRRLSGNRVQNNNKKNLAFEDRSRPRDHSYQNSNNQSEEEPQSRNGSLTPGSKNVYVTITGVVYKKLRVAIIMSKRRKQNIVERKKNE